MTRLEKAKGVKKKYIWNLYRLNFFYKSMYRYQDLIHKNN